MTHTHCNNCGPTVSTVFFIPGLFLRSYFRTTLSSYTVVDACDLLTPGVKRGINSKGGRWRETWRRPCFHLVRLGVAPKKKQQKNHKLLSVGKIMQELQRIMAQLKLTWSLRLLQKQKRPYHSQHYQKDKWHFSNIFSGKANVAQLDRKNSIQTCMCRFILMNSVMFAHTSI